MIPIEPINKKRGRKTMLRRKEACEEVGFNKGRISRKGLKITYSVCGIVGHNKRFHRSLVVMFV